MKKKLTTTNVQAFYRYMAKKFKVKIIYTGSGPIDELADVLGCVGIPADQFIDKFAFTIGSRIYIPWRPGSNTVALSAQVHILCHEIIHAVRQRHKGVVRWLLKYAVKKSFRAHEESKALHANLEVYYALTGRKLNTESMITSLVAYRLRKSDLRVTKKHIDIINRVMVKGKGSSTVSRAAMAWWGVAA